MIGQPLHHEFAVSRDLNKPGEVGYVKLATLTEQQTDPFAGIDITGVVENHGDVNLVFRVLQSDDNGKTDPYRVNRAVVRIGAEKVGNVADGDIVTITDHEGNAVTFEFDDDASVTAGRVLVDIGGDTDDAIANLVAAIDANTTLQDINATDISDTESEAQIDSNMKGRFDVDGLFVAKTSTNLTIQQAPTVTHVGATNLRVGAANALSVTVVPNGRVEFVLDSVTKNFLKLDATPFAFGRVKLAHQSDGDAYLLRIERAAVP